MDWSQLRTILWLRRRLNRNQWSRGGMVNIILTIIVVAIGYVIAVAGALGGLLFGVFILGEEPPQAMLIVCDILVLAFLLFWTIGLVSELQRSETVDISRMLHLPVRLQDIFLVNYIASHVTLSIILFLPTMLGLCLGLILGGRWSMLWMFPLVLGFIFMVTAWTYCLRGWLAALMVNKRRRRAIVAGITFAFVLLSQLPNLLGSFMHDRHQHRPRRVPLQQTAPETVDSQRLRLPAPVMAAHKYVPFLWVGNGAMSLAQGSVLPAVLGAAGAFGIGAVGLRRAYRTTIRFYTGQVTVKKTPPKTRVPKAATVGTDLLEKRVPGVPDEVITSAAAFYRSMMRAPEVKMALATNFMMLLIFGTMILIRRSGGLGEQTRPFIATGAMAFALMGMNQLMFNQFGFERAGFRLLVLLPTPRKWILLGKNLAFVPAAFLTGLIILALCKLALRLSLVVFLATGLQLAAAFLIVTIGGNLLSVLIPHHVVAGSMKQTKTSTTTTLLIILSRLLFTATMIPLFIPPAMGLLSSGAGWLPAGLVNLALSAVLLVLLALAYALSLPHIGRLLQRREKQILQVVTAEVE